MRDLIDRKQALKEIHDRHEKAVEWFLGITNDEIKARAEAALLTFTECYLTIQRLPSAEPKKGKWRKENLPSNSANEPDHEVFYCSECGNLEFRPSHFCRVCGATMEVSE